MRRANLPLAWLHFFHDPSNQALAWRRSLFFLEWLEQISDFDSRSLCAPLYKRRRPLSHYRIEK
jgi:hypothetical protein